MPVRIICKLEMCSPNPKSTKLHYSIRYAAVKDNCFDRSVSLHDMTEEDFKKLEYGVDYEESFLLGLGVSNTK